VAGFSSMPRLFNGSFTPSISPRAKSQGGFSTSISASPAHGLQASGASSESLSVARLSKPRSPRRTSVPRLNSSLNSTAAILSNFRGLCLGKDGSLHL
jgi:hypothetical protein